MPREVDFPSQLKMDEIYSWMKLMWVAGRTLSKWRLAPCHDISRSSIETKKPRKRQTFHKMFLLLATNKSIRSAFLNFSTDLLLDLEFFLVVNVAASGFWRYRDGYEGSHLSQCVSRYYN